MRVVVRGDNGGPMQKLNMEKDLDLQRDYGHDAVCGYVRSPFYERETHTIYGQCAITGRACRKQLPDNIHQCRIFLEMKRK